MRPAPGSTIKLSIPADFKNTLREIPCMVMLLSDENQQ
jgi:hypothetical protein